MKQRRRNTEDPLWWGERLSEAGIVIGGIMAIEHKLHYGRWYDRDRPLCHGKIGLAVLIASSIARIICAGIRALRPKCQYCESPLTYIASEQKYYCSNCKILYPRGSRG